MNRPTATLLLSTITALIIGFSVYLWQAPAKRGALEYALDDLFVSADYNGIIIGSSSAQRLDTSILLCGNWLNRGLGNSIIADLIFYLELARIHSDVSRVIVYAGENDLFQGMGDELAFNQYADLLRVVSARFARAKIHILAIKKSPARPSIHKEITALNTKLERLAEQSEQIRFHSTELKPTHYLSDGIHLNAQGYLQFIAGFNAQCHQQ